MRLSYFSLVVLLAAIWFLAPGQGWLTSSEKEKESVPSKEKSAEVPAPAAPQLDPAFEDILRIREIAGSSLKGSMLENVPAYRSGDKELGAKSEKQAFVESLQRLANDQPQLERPTQTGVARSLTDEDPPPALLTTSSRPLDSGDNSENETADLVTLLRATSRSLDGKASDWDEERRYEDAERLRKLAKQLRREARRLDEQ